MSETPRFTKKEEIANAISHGLGTILSIVGLVLLVIFSSKTGSMRHVFSFSVFGVTMVILYLSSTLNHSLRSGSAKNFFHNFDQIAIFLLIAGTYTPLSLVALNDDWGWTMFGCQWGFAFAGIIAKLFMPNRFEKGVNIFFVISYIFMGWMLLFFILPIFRNIPSQGILLILLGGLCYTLGTIFFKIKNLNYAHLIWHIFVIAGTVFHYVAILWFVLPIK